MTDPASTTASRLTPVPRAEYGNPWFSTAGVFGMLIAIGGLIALFIPAGTDVQGNLDLQGLFAKDFIGSAAVTLGCMLIAVWVLIGAMEWRAARPVR